MYICEQKEINPLAYIKQKMKSREETFTFKRIFDK